MAWIKDLEAVMKLPKLLILRKLSFDFDGIPLSATEIPFSRVKNLVRVGLDELFRSNTAHGFPPILQVEPTNLCNLKCPLCPTGTDSSKRPKGMMTLEMFQKILDELEDVLLAVYLYGYGEPFMNPDLHRMAAACTARNILTLTTTNGHFVCSLDDALHVVDAGLTVLITAVDGSPQSVYESYRKNGDLEKVKRSVALVEEAKVLRKSKFPYTVMRSVIMRQNENEIPELEQLARSLGVNMFAAKSVGCKPGKEIYRSYEPSIPALRRFKSKENDIDKPNAVKCPFPFRQPTVFWDGTLVGSEHDHELEMPFGRIGERPFMNLWNASAAINLRNSIRRGYGRPSFCAHCPHEGKLRRGSEFFCQEFRSL